MSRLLAASIKPYRPPPPQDPSPPPAILTFNETAQLEPYLPPPRTDYLVESPSIPPEADSKDLQLPHVTLTYAQSLDAQISLQPGTQTLLSGALSKSMTHCLRSRHDAILIGAGTALADNPGLNCRYSEDGVVPVGLERQPRPVVLDPSGKVKIGDLERCLGLARRGEGRAVWVVRCEREWEEGKEEERGGLRGVLESIGGGILDVGTYNGREEGVNWGVVLRALAKTGVRSVMIEGGGAVIKDLLRKRNHKYISSVIVTIAPTYLGAGGVGVTPKRSVDGSNEVNLGDVRWIPLGQDVVMAGVLE